MGEVKSGSHGNPCLAVAVAVVQGGRITPWAGELGKGTRRKWVHSTFITKVNLRLLNGSDIRSRKLGDEKTKIMLGF